MTGSAYEGVVEDWDEQCNRTDPHPPHRWHAYQSGTDLHADVAVPSVILLCPGVTGPSRS